MILLSQSLHSPDHTVIVCSVLYHLHTFSLSFLFPDSLQFTVSQAFAAQENKSLKSLYPMWESGVITTAQNAGHVLHPSPRSIRMLTGLSVFRQSQQLWLHEISRPVMSRTEFVSVSYHKSSPAPCYSEYLQEHTLLILFNMTFRVSRLGGAVGVIMSAPPVLSLS